MEQDITTWAGWDALSPALCRACCYDFAPGTGLAMRYVQDFQLLYVQAGSGSASIDSATYPLTAGDVLFCAPNSAHSLQAGESTPLQVIGLHFVFQQADLFLLNPDYPPSQDKPYTRLRGTLRCPLRPTPPPHCRTSPALLLRQRCEALLQSYAITPTGRRLEKRGLLLLLIQAWHEAFSTLPQDATIPLQHQPAMNHAQQLILHNLGNPPETAALAEIVGVSVDYFSRLFKQMTGLPLRDFITQHRLRLSRQLLIEGYLSVEEIAKVTGFNDENHFTRRFQQEFRVKPAVFRAHMGQSNPEK